MIFPEICGYLPVAGAALRLDALPLTCLQNWA